MQFHSHPVFSARLGPIYLIGVLAVLALGAAEARAQWATLRGSLEIEQLSDEWETPEAPVNIENGFGFFGSVARNVETWTLEAADIRQLGYKPPE